MKSKLVRLLPGLVPGLVIGFVVAHIHLSRQSSLTPVTSSPVALTQVAHAPSAVIGEAEPYSETLHWPGLSEYVLTEPQVLTAVAIQELESAELIDSEASAPSPLVPLEKVDELPAVGELPDSSSTDEVPDFTLLDSHHAQAPKTFLNPDAEKVRQLIEVELKDLTGAEREAWYESLKEMNEADATGVVRMWKLFGNGGVGESLHTEEQKKATLTLKPESLLNEAPQAEFEVQSKLDLEVQFMKQENQKFAKTVGAIPLWYSTFSDQSQPDQARSVWSPHFVATKLIKSNLPLDIYCDGDCVGVIEVFNEQGESFFVVSARFALDSENKLVTQIGGQTYFATQGPLDVPKNTLELSNLKIDPIGRIYLMERSNDGAPKEHLVGKLSVNRVYSVFSMDRVQPELFQLSPGQSSLLKWNYLGEADSELGVEVRTGGYLIPDLSKLPQD